MGGTQASALYQNKGHFMCVSMHMKMLSTTSIFFLTNYIQVSLVGFWQQSQNPLEHHCVTAALLGWQLIRSKVLEKFSTCKQHEFVTALHLLEHVVPLVFYQYNIFRTGNLKLYEKVMAEMAIIFICWRRRHYDKSTLSFLSNCVHQCNHLPE